MSKKQHIFIADLRDKHIGEQVIYHPPHKDVSEQGRITSWNDRFIFVSFSTSAHGQACDPFHLFWL